MVTEMSFWDVQRIFASPETARHSFGDISRYAARPLPERVTAEVVDLVAACPSRSAVANGSFWSLGWVGGDVVNAVGRTETAYVHRDLLTLLRPTPVWPAGAPTTRRTSPAGPGQGPLRPRQPVPERAEHPAPAVTGDR